MWTQDQRQAYGELLLITSKLYGFEMNRDMARLIIDDLQDLTFEDCMTALTAFRKNPKNKTWPRAVDIRAAVVPELDENAVAIELTHKIDRLVSEKGWAWSQGVFIEHGTVYINTKNQAFATFQECVESEIGKIGWEVVCRRGGWTALAKSSNEMEEGTFKAQLREQIKSAFALKKSGVKIEELAMPEEVKQLAPKLNLLKGIE